MNITCLRTVATASSIPYRSDVVRLARKLEAASTGHFAKFPAVIFLIQANAIATNPDLMHSIAASLVEVVRTEGLPA